MSVFEFKALDAKGKEQAGVLEAHSIQQVRQLLRDQGWTPLFVTAGSSKARPDGSYTSSGHRISVLELAFVTRQLATLIQASLPLEQALQAVAQQNKNIKVRSLILGVRAGVLEGRSLADSLARFTQVFDRQYRMTVAVGEHSGRFAEVLENLASHTERRHQFRQDIQMALLYPIALLSLALVIVIALVVYVVPQIVVVFEDSARELPWLTQFLVNLSNTVQTHGLWIVGILIALSAAAFKLFSMPFFQTWWHDFLLKLPLFGNLARDSNLVRFVSTLAILVQSNAPVLEALRVAGDVINNQTLRRAVVVATDRISEGESLFSTLQDTGHFPPMVLHMIASGETSGKLAQILTTTAMHQEREFTHKVKLLVKLFEPLMLIVMGALIMLIVLAILLPILQFNQLIE